MGVMSNSREEEDSAYSKSSQLYKNKKEKAPSMFGKKRQTIKKRSVKNKIKPEEKKYYSWLQEQDLNCVACGKKNGIEFHHITDIKRIAGARRDNSRLIPLCGVTCHRLGKDAIHVLSKEEYYSRIKSLKDLLEEAKKIHDKFLQENCA